VVTDDELNAAYIAPSVFHADVHLRVAEAVRAAAVRPAPFATGTQIPGKTRAPSGTAGELVGSGSALALV
jgi:hypothetical protein